MYREGRKGQRRVVEGIEPVEEVDGGWTKASCKQLYSLNCRTTGREGQQGRERTWARVWAKWQAPVAQDALYRGYRNTVLSRERQHRLDKVADPCCQYEVVRTRREGPHTEEGEGPGHHCEGPIGDWQHNHVGCVAIAGLWARVRGMAAMAGVRGEDEDLLWLRFPPGEGAATVTWLVATYVAFIWEEGRRGSRMSERNLLTYFWSAKMKLMGTRAEALINWARVGLG